MQNKLFSVYVNALVTDQDDGRVLITASNGSTEGPPFVKFKVTKTEAENVSIGSRFSVTVEGPM